MAAQNNIPLAYLITFTTYGSWLHGEAKGSVDENHNTYGSEFIRPCEILKTWESGEIEEQSFLLDAVRRQAVLEAVKDVCQVRQWGLLAGHVRSNHVHVVITTDDKPEKVMVDCKAYATRMLRSKSLHGKDGKVWTRHGSTRYLWNEKQLAGAVKYVIYEQGKQMEWYVAEI